MRRAEAGVRRVGRRRRLRLDGGRARASRTTRRRRPSRPCGSRRRSTAPNLYVKIPATAPGLPAIEDSIAHGMPINITLIFSLDRYKAVVEAYLRGLERLVAAGGDPAKVASVASFFVSRVDTEADKRLERASRSCRASLRSRTRSSPTSTTSRRSPGRAGSSSRARAPRSSVASGRRRRRRTRPTAT